MYSFPLMLAPQLPDMEVGNSPSIRCIVLQFSTYIKSHNAAFQPAKINKPKPDVLIIFILKPKNTVAMFWP